MLCAETEVNPSGDSSASYRSSFDDSTATGDIMSYYLLRKDEVRCREHRSIPACLDCHFLWARRYMTIPTLSQACCKSGEML